MRYLAMILALTALAGCTWETYQKADGSTALRQKYEKRHPRLLSRRFLLTQHELQPIPSRATRREA